jgi:hypothetical protein
LATPFSYSLARFSDAKTIYFDDEKDGVRSFINLVYKNDPLRSPQIWRCLPVCRARAGMFSFDISRHVSTVSTFICFFIFAPNLQQLANY